MTSKNDPSGEAVAGLGTCTQQLDGGPARAWARCRMQGGRRGLGHVHPTIGWRPGKGMNTRMTLFKSAVLLSQKTEI
jgi:hypothetical protein